MGHNDGIMGYLDMALGEGRVHPNTSRGLQYSYCCPICKDHKDRMFVHPDRKVFHCHNCDVSGSLITLISEYNSIAWFDALSIYRQYEGYEAPLPDDISTEIHSRFLATPDVIRRKHVHPLPEEFIPMEEARGKYGRQAYEYLKSRGITRDVIEKGYIGYCAEGKYRNRIIMPDFEDGELIYWQARTWLPAPKDEKEKKRYRKVLNPSLTKEEVESGMQTVDKSEVVGNIDFVKEEGMAVLCEGKFDQYAIGDVGACLHGKHMSDTQFLKLVNSKDTIQSIAVMMDGDAFSATMRTAERLYKYYDHILVCKLPEDKDPGSLGKKGILDALTNSIPYTSMFKVKARMKGWI